MTSVDRNNDGKVTVEEKKLNALENADKKASVQRSIAIYSFVAIIAITVLALTPIIPLDRIETLSNLIEMFYMSCAGIIAAFFGAEAWATRR